jgi:hypothetical protein
MNTCCNFIYLIYGLEFAKVLDFEIAKKRSLDKPYIFVCLLLLFKGTRDFRHLFFFIEQWKNFIFFIGPVKMLSN